MQKNYWQHRISYQMEVSYPLLERGILSIGWSDFSTPEFIEEFKSDGNNREIEHFKKKFKERWGFWTKGSYSLYWFLGMKKGDFIIIPSWENFHVYEIQDEKYMSIEEANISDLYTWDGDKIILKDDGFLELEKKKEKVDLGFFRKVELVAKDISRHDYADAALTCRMKARQTTLNISDLSGSINKAIEAFKNEKPIKLSSIILEKCQRRVLDSLKEVLDPTKLENLIKSYMEKAGANIVDIPAKNEPDKEGDADIVATFDHIKTVIYVQAKKHEGTTNEWALEQINDYVEPKRNASNNEHACLTWIISTADNFSEECVKQAREKGTVLINGKEFSKMLLAIGISNFDEI